MSTHDMHNVLVARGTSFKRSPALTTPTGNVHVAPTVLTTIGLPDAENMAGRC